jgi:hypothetical protein
MRAAAAASPDAVASLMVASVVTVRWVVHLERVSDH